MVSGLNQPLWEPLRYPRNMPSAVCRVSRNRPWSHGPDTTLWLIWLEQRPQERGRTTALIRRFGDSEAEAQELTPAPSNLRSRVHDYGGGVLATAVEQDRLILAWIERGCLWRQDWRLPQTSTHQPKPLAASQLSLIHI